MFTDHPESQRRRQLLALLAEHRFATTRQLARFSRSGYTTSRTALRRTQVQLARLNSERLVTHLERRVGGWQGGSSTTIWTLTAKGVRQATARRSSQTRAERLSTSFLEHLLAITEVRLVVQETTSAQRMATEVQGEPDCWRRYPGPLGQAFTLKPDLALTVRSRQFEDRYFIEVDRATENPGRVIRKCQQYETYRATGREQADTGVFPAVIWLVPSAVRQQQLRTHLAREPGLTAGLFQVLLLDELPELIRQGPE